MTDREWVFDADGLDRVARELLAACAPSRVMAIQGRMGAGKTTLVRHLCLALGVGDRVNSPTFSLVNEYAAADGSAVFHIDLYRLSGEEEALQAGIGEVLSSGGLCLLEWPERAPALLPPDACHLTLEVLPDGRRRLGMTQAGINPYFVEEP